MKRYNMNGFAKVKLTNSALEYKKQEYDRFNKKYGTNLEVKLDENGYYRDQIWCLMKDFSHLIHRGGSPFFGSDIFIEDR